MATKYYLAVADRHPKESKRSITFPALPGITSVAENFADVMHQAKDALATAIEDMQRDNEPLPPSIEENALPDYDRTPFHDPRTLLVPVETAGRALRVNVSLDEGLLARIDEVSKRTGLTRSALLYRAARLLIAKEQTPNPPPETTFPTGDREGKFEIQPRTLLLIGGKLGIRSPPSMSTPSANPTA